MTKWQLYITDNNGEGIPKELKVWDDEENFELLFAFAKDAVISFEPIAEEESGDSGRDGAV